MVYFKEVLRRTICPVTAGDGGGNIALEMAFLCLDPEILKKASSGSPYPLSVNCPVFSVSLVQSFHTSYAIHPPHSPSHFYYQHGGSRFLKNLLNRTTMSQPKSPQSEH
jgi:hypothetical protein